MNPEVAVCLRLQKLEVMPLRLSPLAAKATARRECGSLMQQGIVALPTDHCRIRSPRR